MGCGAACAAVAATFCLALSMAVSTWSDTPCARNYRISDALKWYIWPEFVMNAMMTSSATLPRRSFNISGTPDKRPRFQPGKTYQPHSTKSFPGQSWGYGARASAAYRETPSSVNRPMISGNSGLSSSRQSRLAPAAGR